MENKLVTPSSDAQIQYNFTNQSQIKSYPNLDSLHRIDQVELISSYLAQIDITDDQKTQIKKKATHLIQGIKNSTKSSTIVDNLMHEYDLSSSEGIALMCLAESLLRIPDSYTADLLIQDKLANHDWKSRIKKEKTLFINASAWALFVTGKVINRDDHSEKNLKQSLNKILNVSSAPLIRSAMKTAMKVLGNKFIVGETIDLGLENTSNNYKRGYRYSFDLLGEAAATMEDAEAYYEDYRAAIFKIGQQVETADYRQNNGISVKLSALHPRFSISQHDIVFKELYPKLKQLCMFAREFNLGLNIDAEESERQEITLEIFERLIQEKELKDFTGLGMVVQAYSKRTSAVIDAIIAMARQHNHPVMIRLVKGAYWDSEIKRAQAEGLSDYPVFTKRTYTDVSYIYCAQKLLAAQDVIYPQFATHNAQTLATIYTIAGDKNYEFQCLFGMSDALSEQVIGKENLDRVVRIYAPIGNHQTLLAYLVRRILENGANSSFINQIANVNFDIEKLVSNPVDVAPTLFDLPNFVELPQDIYQIRKNSQGFDWNSVTKLTHLQSELNELQKELVHINVTPDQVSESSVRIINPASLNELVGYVNFDSAEHAKIIIDKLSEFKSSLTIDQRAIVLEQAADKLQAKFSVAMDLLIREAGKTIDNAIAEIREAIDFLRYYALQLRTIHAEKPIVLDSEQGIAVCISPWNFPLAIFLGQIAAAFAAGKKVIAKPAEQTNGIAKFGIELLTDNKFIDNEIQILYGLGENLGPVICKHPALQVIMFTGSIEVAKILQAAALSNTQKVTLIAETGGQNALVTDSTALPEQLLIDIMQSSFNSAGQRCSALRLLCVQEDNAKEFKQLLQRAMTQLRLGNPKNINVDIGPVIDLEAQQGLLNYITDAKTRGLDVIQPTTSHDLSSGYFVQPTLIEIDSIAELTTEKFGPILHFFSYKAKDRQEVINQINELGFGLTSCIHSRIDGQVYDFIKRINTGNIYINRNQIGAIVGVQPFGGHGMSGTGPKAGGPLYIHRILDSNSWSLNSFDPTSENELYNIEQDADTASALSSQIRQIFPERQVEFNELLDKFLANNPLKQRVDFKGITGEDNFYIFKPKEGIAVSTGSLEQEFTIYLISRVLGTPFYITPKNALAEHAQKLGITVLDSLADNSHLATLVVLNKLSDDTKQDLNNKPGSLWFLVSFEQALSLYPLVSEVSVSWNTAAAGGNATLMASVA